MDIRKMPVLVLGGTGRQGGAVADHLLQRGFAVHVLTRDTTQPQAQRLRKLGARLVQADLADADALEGAMRGMKGVYSVQSWERGIDLEIEQGIRVAEVAHRLHIDFFVYSSVAGADRAAGVPHFESKYVIEGRISELDLKATILRPTYFMDNFLTPLRVEELDFGVLRLPLPPDVPLQMVAVTDIGAIAALAFEHPEEWTGRTLELAGDQLTMVQVTRALSRKLGTRLNYQEIPIEEFRLEDPNRALMFEWYREGGPQVDIRACRLLHPQLLTFEQWLNTVHWPVPALSR